MALEAKFGSSRFWIPGLTYIVLIQVFCHSRETCARAGGVAGIQKYKKVYVALIFIDVYQ